jgi:hypothetical protein
MARVTFPMGIERVSVRVRDVCFRTMKATGRTYMSSMPSKRTTKLQASEIEARERFARKARLVRAMRQAGAKRTIKELWKIAEQVA